MHHILIVEDELAMQQGLKDNFELEGYRVDTSANGKEALSKIKSITYNLIILDVMLPEMSGFDVCKQVRKEGIQTPIILLTAKSEEIDKVLGLEFGADDYITKPFSLRELLARVKAVLRRSAPIPSTEKEWITIGQLAINFQEYTANNASGEVKMSHREIDLLHYIYNNKNQTVSRETLMEKVWEMDADITTRTIDNFIVKLRQKVEINPNEPRIIHTIHGVGYKLVM